MASSSAMARRSAYLFLVLCFGGLLAFGGYQLYLKYGPADVSVEGIPFGLPAGTSLSKGDAPDFEGEISKLPPQTKNEIRRAQDFARSGALRQAAEIYDALVLLFPDMTAAAWGEANALFEMDSISDLQQDRLEFLTRIIQSRYPKSGIAHYMDSRTSAKAGNHSVALELARAARAGAPSLYEVRLWLAKILLENNQLTEAAMEAHTAVSLSKGESAQAYEILARVYHQNGMLDSCGLLVEYALSQFPVSSSLLLMKGFLTEYRGDFDDAEKIYQRILAIRPDYTPAQEASRTIGEKVAPGTGSVGSTPQDRAQLACDILEPLVERYPDNLPLREALGVAYQKGHRYDRARAQFQEIQKADPEYPEIATRIQETKMAVRVAAPKADGLTADLNRAVDSLRGSNKPSSSHDFSTMLGHYLVRYGASPKEFFKHYSITNFRPVAKNAWQETFYDTPYRHTYTVVFDSLNRFARVNVTVYDSSSSSNHMGMAPEVYTRLLKQNSRISGIGNSTGETACSEEVVIDAAVWETQDNFEILARFVGKPAEVRMVRFDKNALPPGLKLCDYIPYLTEY